MTIKHRPTAGRFGGWRLDLLFTYQASDGMPRRGSGGLRMVNK